MSCMFLCPGGAVCVPCGDEAGGCRQEELQPGVRCYCGKHSRWPHPHPLWWLGGHVWLLVWCDLTLYSSGGLVSVQWSFTVIPTWSVVYVAFCIVVWSLILSVIHLVIFAICVQNAVTFVIWSEMQSEWEVIKLLQMHCFKKLLNPLIWKKRCAVGPRPQVFTV